MSDSFGFVITVAVLWLAIGVALSIVMGRRGHSGFGWLVLGTVLGPLGLVLAVDARRHAEQLEPGLVRVGARTNRSGSVDVLIGFDGSDASAHAFDAVARLLGDRLGRLTVATVVPFGEVRESERAAKTELRALGRRTARYLPELEILHGRPSAALQQRAVEGSFDLVVVGVRGKGLSTAVLGSAASELARDSEVPVLLVGGRVPHATTTRHGADSLASTS